jgi:hypothetical protein
MMRRRIDQLQILVWNLVTGEIKQVICEEPTLLEDDAGSLSNLFQTFCRNAVSSSSAIPL